MRPRRERRGERFQLVAPTAQPERFNAATARAPWRTSNGDRPRGRDWPRFNAATARAPWRTADFIVAARDLVLASMRPRRERRGERPETGGSGGAARRFNAATARAPWRTWK